MDTTQIDVNLIRAAVQDSAYRAWENAGRKASIVMATGVGKSKLAVRRVMEIAGGSPVSGEVLLVTPTEKLRDENWPAEFMKWGMPMAYVDKLVKRICFASLKNEKGNKYKLVILDEVHRLTSLNAEGFQERATEEQLKKMFGDDYKYDPKVFVPVSITQFFADNMAEEVMGLTATEPDKDRDKIKYEIFQQIAPVCFRYSLDQAVSDGIIPPYEIRLIMVPLEKILKEIPAGTKKNPFLTTEQASYEYINKQVMKAQIASRKNPNSKWAQSMYGIRMRFLCNLPSKTRVAKKLMEKVLPGKRTLIFCGSIEQSRELCGNNVYNSSPEDKKRDMLTVFKNQQINYLGVVNAVNEGHNIEEMDQAIVVQLNSNERDLTQRIGRVLRYRPGHTPMVYIIVAQGTKDQDWATKALADFDRKRIVYDSYLNYVT
jgi:superfamily II DNA or RNA helicase